MSEKPANPAKLREEIDEERGADIEDHPGAAPLGTSMESAPNAATREQMKIARRQEDKRHGESED